MGIGRSAQLLLAALLLAVPASTHAQVPDSASAEAPRPGQQLDEYARRTLQLSDAQLEQLRTTNRRYVGQRRALNEEERAARGVLRLQLGAEHADTMAVRGALNQLFAIQQRRLALREQEQGDLATFLTPVQRARLLAMQEQTRRFLQERRREQKTRIGGAAPVRPRPRSAAKP